MAAALKFVQPRGLLNAVLRQLHHQVTEVGAVHPELRLLPPGNTTHVFTASPDHVGVEEYDLAAQIAVSRHWWVIDGELETFSSPHRYVWPSEFDLMALHSGMTLIERWADWNREPFTGESRSHISVWQKTPSP